jgi:cobalamin biosynthesis protein CobW
MTQKLPVTVVTGFLGAGKTSLLRHLVKAGGRRLGLLINEFGEVGIDRELLLGCDASCAEDRVIELANGCICCAVAEDFLPALTRLLEVAEPPEHIVVETSGLALPKPLLQAFSWPEIKARVTVDGVISVIDAASLAAGAFAPASRPGFAAHDDPLEEVFGDQLRAADLVLLNKADLVPERALAAAAEALAARLRPGVAVVRAAHAAVHPALVLGLSAAAEDDLAARPSCHDLEATHDHDDFESFVIARPAVADPARFAETLAAAMTEHGILRAKGFLDVPALPFRHVVQAVGPRVERYFDRPWKDGERASRLVVIGLKGLDRAAIERALGA